MVKVKIKERIYSLSLDEFLAALVGLRFAGEIEVIDYPC